MEDFSLRQQSLISKLRSHGVTIDEEEAVSKYLHSVPAKSIQIALSIEMMLDLSTLTIEDVTGVAPGFKDGTRYTPYVSPGSQISHIATNKGNINRQCLNT